MDEPPVIGIVDDDESIRLALASLVRSAGYATRVFASAEEFLEAGDVQSLRCLIVDWRMPGMDGLQLVRHLAAAGHELPIIVLTAHGSDVVRDQALDAGAVAFLPKPFDAAALLAAVDLALRG